jgi:hypothetical protein
MSEVPFGSWNRSTERNRDREHLEFRRSERKQYPNDVVYTRVCVNDHRCPRRRPRHVLRFISRLDPAPYRVSGLWISEESDQRLWRTPGEEMEESAISSRTSNHRPTRLMELFGNWNRSHPRSRRRRKPTGSRVAAGASVAVGNRIEVLARTAWDPPYKAARLDLCHPSSRSLYPPSSFRFRGCLPRCLSYDS